MSGMNDTSMRGTKMINILLVEDNPADVLLTAEALRESRVSHDLNVVNNGSDALAYVNRQEKYGDAVPPDIILLDINLPKKNGFEVLAEIKQDPALKHIPVIILTTSSSKQDIRRAYDLYANCYIVKPIELDDFFKIIKYIGDFWFTVARLP
jgi:chemotaxis family two-component system response regulator Rcp1